MDDILRTSNAEVDMDNNTGTLETRKREFARELRNLINTHYLEEGSDTPDFVLAAFLMGCLESFEKSVEARAEWYAAGNDQIEDEEDDG